MKLYAPEYYKNFKCTADKCTHSCCIGWEIDIDSDTMQKYSAISHPYGDEIRSTIDSDGAPHFTLGKDERCPHLNKDGLCKIIIELGEDCLCDICREHPRFYNDTPQGKEVGIGMACEEAARLILSSDNYADMVDVGDIDGDEEPLVFDALPLRWELFTLLTGRYTSYEEKLCSVYDAFGVRPRLISDSHWHEIIAELEYLDPSHRELFSCYSSSILTPAEITGPLERALAYFVYRHCTAACNEDDFSVRLIFCLFCERLLASLIKAGGQYDEESIIRLARTVSEELEYSEDNTERIKAEFIF